MANRAARLKKLEAKAQAMATAAHPPRLVVVYEDDFLPVDLRAHDLVIRVLYEQKAHADARSTA